MSIVKKKFQSLNRDVSKGKRSKSLQILWRDNRTIIPAPVIQMPWWYISPAGSNSSLAESGWY